MYLCVMLLYKGHRVPAHEKFFYLFPLETGFFFAILE